MLEVDWQWVPELYVMEKGHGSPKIYLVLTDRGVVLEEQAQVGLPKVLWNMLQVGSLPDVGFLLRGKGLTQPLPSLLAAGNRGDKLGTDLLE